MANGKLPIVANLDLQGERVFNLEDPTNPQDAATKRYVDTPFGSTRYEVAGGDDIVFSTIPDSIDTVDSDISSTQRMFLNSHVGEIFNGLSDIDVVQEHRLSDLSFVRTGHLVVTPPQLDGETAAEWRARVNRYFDTGYIVANAGGSQSRVYGTSIGIAGGQRIPAVTEDILEGNDQTINNDLATPIRETLPVGDILSAALAPDDEFDSALTFVLIENSPPLAIDGLYRLDRTIDTAGKATVEATDWEPSFRIKLINIVSDDSNGVVSANNDVNASSLPDAIPFEDSQWGALEGVVPVLETFGPVRYEIAVGDTLEFDEIPLGTATENTEVTSSARISYEGNVAEVIELAFADVTFEEDGGTPTGFLTFDVPSANRADFRSDGTAGRFVFHPDTVERRIFAAYVSDSGGNFRFKLFHQEGDDLSSVVAIDSNIRPGATPAGATNFQVGLLRNVRITGSVASFTSLPDVVVDGQTIILTQVDGTSLEGIYIGRSGNWEPAVISPITVAPDTGTITVLNNEVVLAGGIYYRNTNGGSLVITAGSPTTPFDTPGAWARVLDGGITAGTYAVGNNGNVTLPKAVGDDVTITGIGGGSSSSFDTNTAEFVDIVGELGLNTNPLTVTFVNALAQAGPNFSAAAILALSLGSESNVVNITYSTPFNLLTTRGYEEWVVGRTIQTGNLNGNIITGEITSVDSTTLILEIDNPVTLQTISQITFGASLRDEGGDSATAAGSVEIFAPFFLDDDSLGTTSNVDGDTTLLTRNTNDRITEVSAVDLVQILQRNGVTSIDTHTGTPNTLTLEAFELEATDANDDDPAAIVPSFLDITFTSNDDALAFYRTIAANDALDNAALTALSTTSFTITNTDAEILIEATVAGDSYIRVTLGANVVLSRRNAHATGRIVLRLTAPTPTATTTDSDDDIGDVFNGLSTDLGDIEGTAHRTIIVTSINSVHSTGDVHLVGADGVNVTRVEQGDPGFVSETNGIKISTLPITNRLDHLTEEVSNLLSDTNAIADGVSQFTTFSTTGPVNTSLRIGDEIETFTDFNSREDVNNVLTTAIDMGISDILEESYTALSDAQRAQVACVVMDFSATQADLINDVLLEGRGGSGANLTFTRNDADPLSSNSEWTCINGQLAAPVNMVGVFTDVEFYSEIQQPITPDQTIFGSYDPGNTTQVEEVTALDGFTGEFFRIYMQIGEFGTHVSLDATESTTFLNTDFFGSYVSFDTDFIYDVNGERIQDLTPLSRSSILVYPEGLGVSSFVAVLTALEEDRTLLVNDAGNPRFNEIDDSWIDGRIAREDQIFGDLHPDTSLYEYSAAATADFKTHTNQNDSARDGNLVGGSRLEFLYNQALGEDGDDGDSNTVIGDGTWIVGNHYAFGPADDEDNDNPDLDTTPPIARVILTEIEDLDGTATGFIFEFLDGYEEVFAITGRIFRLNNDVFDRWYTLENEVVTGDFMTFDGYDDAGQPQLTNTTIPPAVVKSIWDGGQFVIGSDAPVTIGEETATRISKRAIIGNGVTLETLYGFIFSDRLEVWTTEARVAGTMLLSQAFIFDPTV